MSESRKSDVIKSGQSVAAHFVVNYDETSDGFDSDLYYLDKIDGILTSLSWSERYRNEVYLLPLFLVDCCKCNICKEKIIRYIFEIIPERVGTHKPVRCIGIKYINFEAKIISYLSLAIQKGSNSEGRV